MAISRHKVLSEMQQQLELASSKCGNLQKQLEIVKDKVRQSSTTNLVLKEPPDEKENKMKNGEVFGNQGETEGHQEYEKVMSLSSSSTEDVNEERDVNIIKVFYDRLGQMDYPAGHVELSDISSEENDLDIDQLLSSVNFATSNNEKTENEKRKEKRSDKKAKEKLDKNRKKKSKGKTLKAPMVSPYESHLTRISRQSPLKMENRRNKINLKPTADRPGVGNTNQKPISRGQTPKTEKLRKGRQASSGMGSITKNNGKQLFQEPIKRVINMVRELRKTKSSTGAGKKDLFTDSRSLTRLHSDTTQGKSLGARRSEHTQEIVKQPDKSTSNESHEEKKTQPSIKGKQIVASGKSPVRVTRVDSIPKKAQEVKRKREEPPRVNRMMKDKETSLSDLAKASVVKKSQENNTTLNFDPDIDKNVTSANRKIVDTVIIPQKSIAAGKVTSKTINGKISTHGVADKKTKIETKDDIARPKISNPKLIQIGTNTDKTKNGIITHLVPPTEDNPRKSDVRQKVNIFERAIPKEKISTEVPKKSAVNERVSKSRATTMTTITRTNSIGTLYEDSSRMGKDEIELLPSVNNLPPVLPVIRGEPKEKDNAEINPLTINQIRRMKDNLMKFNAIPFIVGQSTTKSYHIGLNIQQTYSLFKQTPSMTALKVSKFADNDQHSIHSRGRSTRTGYSGRSLSTVRGRDTCPACGPAPDPSPEQLADPWAVPQDDDRMVIRVCTCLPKRIISFDQVLNQLYFTDMNLIKLNPNLLPGKELASEEAEDIDSREKPANLLHRGTNTLYYTKLLRSIQNLKDNILG